MSEPGNERPPRAGETAAAGRRAQRLLWTVIGLLILLNLVLLAYAMGWLGGGAVDR